MHDKIVCKAYYCLDSAIDCATTNFKSMRTHCQIIAHFNITNLNSPRIVQLQINSNGLAYAYSCISVHVIDTGRFNFTPMLGVKL